MTNTIFVELCFIYFVSVLCFQAVWLHNILTVIWCSFSLFLYSLSYASFKYSSYTTKFHIIHTPSPIKIHNNIMLLMHCIHISGINDKITYWYTYKYIMCFGKYLGNFIIVVYCAVVKDTHFIGLFYELN